MRLIFITLGLLLMYASELQALDIITIEQPQHHAMLKSSASAVTFPLSPEERLLIAAMRQKLQELGGVGLAAPQVNHAKRIIAVYISKEAACLREDAQPYPMHILINPAYEPMNPNATAADFEACYSVASKAGKVNRFTQIKLHYQDEAGKKQEKIVSGFYARVLQHEIDHINGTLIIDRLTPDCIQGTIEEMRALRRQELSASQRKLFDKFMAKKD